MTTPASEQPASVAAQARNVASKKPAPKKAPPAKRKATKPAPKKKPAPPAKSKVDILISLIGRKNGATLSALMAATDWQAHSVRGFISLAQSRRGLKIQSEKNKAGERVYSLAESKGAKK